jgi:hypothetical protein
MHMHTVPEIENYIYKLGEEKCWKFRKLDAFNKLQTSLPKFW